MIDYKIMRESKNCVIWTRVSTKYQEDNGGSLDTQKEICTDYANREGLKIIDFFGGKHESAKTPGIMIKAMYERVKKDKSISIIIVSEFDRFSRCSWQACKMLDEMRDLGIIVVAAKYGLSTRTKEGMMMAKNTLNMSEWDNQNRTDKFVDGRIKCMLSGAWCQKAPLGYNKDGKSRETWCYLNKDGELIKQAFKWKLQGYSNREILSNLSLKGLSISKQGFHKILVNPFYAGKICNKLTDYEMIDGRIEPAVSYDDFLKVQDILSGKTGQYKHCPNDEAFPLNKYVMCANDRTPFTSYVKKKNSKQYRYYKCNKVGCKTNVSAEEMHRKFEEMLSQYELPEELCESYSYILKQLLMRYSEEMVSERTLWRKKLSEVEKDIRTVKTRYATGVIDSETHIIAITELQEKKDKITLELGKCNLNLSNLEESIPSIIAIASNVRGLWHDSDLTVKRRLQNLIFPDGVLWDKQICNYRTITRNGFFDVLDQLSITYGNKKGAAPDETVPLCG